MKDLSGEGADVDNKEVVKGRVEVVIVVAVEALE